jgi:hypothetical protein
LVDFEVTFLFTRDHPRNWLVRRTYADIEDAQDDLHSAVPLAEDTFQNPSGSISSARV